MPERTCAALLALALPVTAFALLRIVGPDLGDRGGEPWGAALVDLVAVGIPAGLGLAMGRRGGLDVGLGRPSGCALLASVAVGLGLPGLGGLVPLFLGPTSTIAVSPAPIPDLLLASAVVPAVCEEMLLRGVVLGALLRIGPGWMAIAAAALASGALHGTGVAQVSAVAQGAVLGLLACRAHSAWPAVLAHALSNAGILVVATAGIALPAPVLLAGAAMGLTAALWAGRSALRRPPGADDGDATRATPPPAGASPPPRIM
ncbi:MAG: CPBP family intramembrane metalloprotease [Deltaproteobacteria bacterium]|nr:CPBP family intramembrane metalloprotease [Deltaproteobacteria bacterium]